MGAVSTDMKARHTPGPWICDRTGFIKDPLGRVIGQANRVSNDANENVSNGFLLAASPELLAALREARRVLQGHVEFLTVAGRSQEDTADLFALRDIVKQTDDAIAKAMGGESQ